MTLRTLASGRLGRPAGSHLFSASGEINPLDLSVAGKQLVEVLPRGLAQVALKAEQAAFLLLQGFLNQSEQTRVRERLTTNPQKDAHTHIEGVVIVNLH